MKRMAEVGWRSRAAKVLPRGMYGHQVDDDDGGGDLSLIASCQFLQ